MNILLFMDAVLPAVNYGGTQRVVWDLAYALSTMGHRITLLAAKGTVCPFAKVIDYNPEAPFEQQVPKDIDIVHAHSQCNCSSFPIVHTMHGNSNTQASSNTIFVSKNHALRHGGSAYVHNGLNWDNYPEVSLNAAGNRQRFHFLGKAAWRLKNVQGAIDITKLAKQQLDVLGGHRFNIKMGVRFTFDRHVRFHGMVNDVEKSSIMSGSKGLVFPVTWHEPFGLAITESLYFGCPVFATPYGSLPELVSNEVGLLSDSQPDLVTAVSNAEQFSSKVCHEYARDLFNAHVMAERYLGFYDKIINNQPLNEIKPDWQPAPFKKLPYKK
ncbi:glycosyltransferase [Vibrio ulleungensis]|uniref:Glycosyltransferase n=1 Tax=Vibrio ulleungensis TaxID=2807619 RepID=A0ABS2HP65_9VIBR|nr:glycosyltransferase [Vibrio ulleungensis]MBM7037677.1 glycosyltransferase [Vibrio ulleungensis]